ncbi:putative disease resistance protein RGA3 isoform X1 [Punica granatum]|nr:putative disease resistance protein RGA3 isoform X1 [Punica granatum]XP_031374402.1 putative disease resistance protein RGA3 isoform X1 [Punica granatum]XP_031374403.1 putative disease resistance protein RGA3 isoform X1 [Punica granatum]XP_031374404.1 putative disease resistance protein RGA3 isoform X1 [Punica granatum]XP_031374405.1 putative disease resistance protein RGA3 isoform X1 [Punica granatum]XP_031374406.1 putative disease resistance protein RGA3 isoform X1 [Punica granatum]XP_03
MFSSWVSQLHRLVQIEIIDCDKCSHLPPLDQLPFLKKVSLQKMINLESIELWESSGGQEDKESGMPQSNNNFFPSLEEIELRWLPKFRGWERRTSTRIEREADDHSSSSSLLMLHTFSDKVKVSIEYCPVFSYAHGQKLRQLGVTTNKQVQMLLRDASLSQDPTPVLTVAPIPPSMMTMTAVSSKSLSTLTQIIFSGMEDAEDFPVELFRSLPSLQSLVISECNRLKALPVRAILQYLPSLEMLEISSCEELDLSMDEDSHDGVEEGMNNLQLQGHLRLRDIKIKRIHKMEALPGWFQYLSNLENLEIILCRGLKSLPGRLILPLLTKLVSLELYSCPQLDFSGESGNQLGMPNLQSGEPTKLRDLEFHWIDKMKTLPWWMQHLTNLEELIIGGCGNLKALPEWFPNLTSLKVLRVYGCGKELPRRCRRNTGEDWPKISHIQYVDVDN